MSIRVILVDDHPVVRAGLRSVVDAPEHIAVIGEADSGEGALAIVDELDPDCALSTLVIGEPRKLAQVNYILNNSFGMLGINSVVIIKRF